MATHNLTKDRIRNTLGCLKWWFKDCTVTLPSFWHCYFTTISQMPERSVWSIHSKRNPQNQRFCHKLSPIMHINRRCISQYKEAVVYKEGFILKREIWKWFPNNNQRKSLKSCTYRAIALSPRRRSLSLSKIVICLLKITRHWVCNSRYIHWFRFQVTFNLECIINVTT